MSAGARSLWRIWETLQPLPLPASDALIPCGLISTLSLRLHVSLCLLLFLSYVRTYFLDFRPTQTIQDDLSSKPLTKLHLQKLLLHIKSHSCVLGNKTFRRGTNQPLTCVWVYTHIGCVCVCACVSARISALCSTVGFLRLGICFLYQWFRVPAPIWCSSNTHWLNEWAYHFRTAS